MAKLTKSLRKRIMKYCELNGLQLDIDSLWDSSLTVEENLANMGLTTELANSDYFKKLKEEERKFKVRMINETIKYAKQQLEKNIERIVRENITELDNYFIDLYNIVESFIKNDRVNGLIIVGKRGMGKSFNVIKKLKEMNVDFELVKGHFTPLSLFKFLYQNNNKILVFDDTLGLLDNDDNLNILLGALDYDNKIVTWSSMSPLTQDLPNKFVFEGKIILLINEIERNDSFIEALKDRCFYFEMNFTNEQIIEMLYIIANKRNIEKEVVDFIKDMATVGLKNLSLRLLDKVYAIYRTNKKNWKKLAKQQMQYDMFLEIVYELIRSGKSVKEQIKEWQEKTGYGRRYYFYYKAKLLNRNSKIPNSLK